MRVLVTGASGSGTTTLGRALSRELEASFFDVDDYFWVPTEPPYQQQRDSSARLSLLLADLAKAPQRLKCGFDNVVMMRTRLGGRSEDNNN